MRIKRNIILLLLALCPYVQGQSVKIIFAGDLMSHMPQVNAAKQADGSYDYSPCFRYIKPYVQSADLAIVNLEVPLDGKPYSGYPQFSAPDALAACAKEAGFDIMTTTNNHCMDRGRHGLERTLRVLDSLGIPHLGTYRDRAKHDKEHPLMVMAPMVFPPWNPISSTLSIPRKCCVICKLRMSVAPILPLH